MTTLQDVMDIAGRERYLAVVSTVRADATVQSSVVNAGVLPHPVDGDEVVGFVTYGKAKLANLRARPQVSVTFRSGWEWATVEGPGRADRSRRSAPRHRRRQDSASCCARCSRRPVARTTTGRPTTGPWPNSDAPPCWSRPPGSTATEGERTGVPTGWHSSWRRRRRRTTDRRRPGPTGWPG